MFNSALAGLLKPPSAGAEHDLFAALIGWTNQAKAPYHVVATKYAGPLSQVVAFQRRLSRARWQDQLSRMPAMMQRPGGRSPEGPPATKANMAATAAKRKST